MKKLILVFAIVFGITGCSLFEEAKLEGSAIKKEVQGNYVLTGFYKITSPTVAFGSYGAGTIDNVFKKDRKYTLKEDISNSHVVASKVYKDYEFLSTDGRTIINTTTFVFIQLYEPSSKSAFNISRVINNSNSAVVSENKQPTDTKYWNNTVKEINLYRDPLSTGIPIYIRKDTLFECVTSDVVRIYIKK